MSVPLDAFLLHHPSKVREDLITLMKEGPHLYNGMYFLLTPRRSLHYRALKTGDFVPYNEIIATHDPSLGHSEEAFRQLAQTFSPDKMENILANVFMHTKKLWVVDGAHRLAIAAYQKVWGDSIPLRYVDASYQPEVKTYLEDKLRDAAASLESLSPPAAPSESAESLESLSPQAPAESLSPPAASLSPPAASLSPHPFGLYSVALYNFRLAGPIPTPQVAECLRRAVSFEHKTVFCVGCNTGMLLFHLPECARVVGVDNTEASIKCCQRWGTWLFYTTNYTFVMDQGMAANVALLLETRPEISMVSLVSRTCPKNAWSDRRLLGRLVYALHGQFLLETDCDDVLDDYREAQIVLLWNGVPECRIKWFLIKKPVI